MPRGTRTIDLTETRPAIRPPRLAPGARIGVVAPSGPADEDELLRGLADLRERGYEVVEGQSLRAVRGYLAGRDGDRAADLNAMFADPSIGAIFCARGGYGTTRLLDLLDYGLIARHPRILTGYSDITGLHVALRRRAGLVTFHGPVLQRAENQPVERLERMLAVLSRPEPVGPLGQPEGGPELVTVHPGEAEGELVGGNLSLVTALIGTPYEADTEGKILILEDVNEAPYRIDRQLQQLTAAGKLDALAGVVFGEAVRCQPAPGSRSFTLLEVLDDFFARRRIPCFYGLAFGHGRGKLTIPLGVRARLDAGARTLTVLDAAVT